MKCGVHGGDVYTASAELGIDRGALLDFSANINPLGVPEGVKEAMVRCLDLVGDYPDPWCRELRGKLGECEEVPEAFLICGNGAADLIFRLAYALRPRRALVLAPTFAEYEEALRQVGCEVGYYELAEEDDYRLGEDFLERLDEDMDILFVCNPNNPTGQVTPVPLMVKILERCKERGIWVVADECFNDFLEAPEAYTLKGFLKDYPKLFILKAFTKLYAMAGVRLGYGMTSNEALLSKLYESAQPWSVSSIAQAAGLAALEENAYREATKVLIREERAYLKEGLRMLGFKVYGSYANYIFFKNSVLDKNNVLEENVKRQACYMKKCSKDILDLVRTLNLVGTLREKGVLIRDCSNYKGLGQGYFRIAVRTRAENNRLIEALKEICIWQK